MSVKWTSDQLAAINTTDKAVVVSAAAGSGKTAVLIERTIRLLCDENHKYPADKLLAVTFTKDAAAQMKSKLSEALVKRIENNPSDEWLQLQQMKLSMAKISTINSFCLDLVKKNIDKFNISSSVRILEDNESIVMLDNAIENVLEVYYETDIEMMDKLNKAFCNDSDSKLIEIIKKLYSFSRSLPFKDSWFDKLISTYCDDEENEKYRKLILRELASDFSGVYTACMSTYKMANSLKCFSKTKQIISSDVVIFQRILDCINANDFDTLKNTMSGIKFSTFNSNADKNVVVSDIEKAEVENIKNNRDNYKKRLDDIRKILFSFDDNKQELLNGKEILQYLVKINNALWNEMSQMKQEKNAVDFSDVEIMTIELLCRETSNGLERTELAQEIVNSGEYKIIMIDEYQDVNNLQDIIFRALSDTDDINIIGKNMFVVGDVKQSIYRFRQANPNIFINLRKIANIEDNKDIITEIDLRKNFRSRNNIIDFTNFIFKGIMSEYIGEVDYNEKEQLVYGADYDENEPATDIVLLDDNFGMNEIDEPLATAKIIRKMLDDKAPVNENGTSRPCKPGDFCILLRNNKSSKDYVKALSNVGIMASGEELTGYLRSREISLLINMLKLIDNPMNDIAFTSVLLSGIYMFSEDDLFKLKNIDAKLKLYQIFIGISNDEYSDVDDTLKDHCKSVLDNIRELRFYSSSYSVERMIRKIYDSTDFLSVSSVCNDGTQRRANLRLLLEYADSYEKTSQGGISGFLHYLHSIFESGNDMNQAGQAFEASDSVIIKTMHKSKGLEFPFVFLCSMSKTFKKPMDELNFPMLINAESGIGFKLNYPDKYIQANSLPYRAIAYAKKCEVLSEEMRLLYVAVTRAKERLVITVPLKDQVKKMIAKYGNMLAQAQCLNRNIVKNANSMLDWIIMSLLMHKDASLIRNICERNYEIPVIPSNANINIYKYNDDIYKNIINDNNTEEVFIQPDEKLVKELKDNFSFEYNSNNPFTQSKLTVSEVSKPDNVLGFFYQIPKLDEEIGSLTAAEKGTATHALMQLCDFAKAEENLDDEIERLVGCGLLSEKQASAIDKRSVKDFFENSFYKRMKNSNNIIKERQFLVMIDDLKLDDEILKEYNNTDGMLQGIADCIFEESDGYVLVDYKTDRIKTIDELRESYSVQIMLYKKAFDIILDKPVKSSYIYSFALRQGIEIKL